MDEQRMQAYVALIEQLLACPQGQEAEILRANAELVDAGLLDMMQRFADSLESQGNSNTNWLREFAAQLAQMLQTETGSAGSDLESAEQFLLETLQLVSDSQGNPRQVYPVWEQQQPQFNAALLTVLPQVAARLYKQAPERQMSIASVLGGFGDLIQQFPLATRWLNLELGIAAYQATLQVYSRDAFPQDWATTQNALAIAYLYRIRGERADSLEQAISACQAALQVYSRDAFPQDWAMTQNTLANAYSNRVRGERADNLEQAITAYQNALQVYSRDAFPREWAVTQNNLANAYSNRIRGEQADNLEQAITAYQNVLQVRTRNAFPQDWAMTQNNLANAYSNRIRGERADNLERAITACQNALQVRTCDAFPQDWATTQNTLAEAYLYRIRGKRADNLEQAITACQNALQVYSRDAFPERWAMTQNNLANAYSIRIRGERADNLEQAITAYQNALQVRTRNAFPEQWAMTQDNLANAYSIRIRGERADNLEQAITAYQNALQVRTRNAFPEQWAATQNNLATTYLYRIRGERADNLEQAITAYQNALQVYSRDAFPERWAATQDNLAIAYSNRIRGEQADNLEQAITAYQNALQVRTRNAFPQGWATTQNNLANAYSNRIRGERADNLEQAITACQAALQVLTRDAFPNECRQTARNLGNLHFEQQTWADAAAAYETALDAAEALYQACIFLEGKAAELTETADLPRRTAYALARSGSLSKAVEVLERGRARGLSESLDRDRANLDALQLQNPDLSRQYKVIAEQLRSLESQQRDHMGLGDREGTPLETLRDTAIQLRQDLTATIAQIRQVPGYEDFLDQPNYADIQAALQPDRPLVYLVPTTAGSLALIVTPNGITDLWCDELTENSLGELFIGSGDVESSEGGWFTSYFQASTNRQAWFDAIDQGTRQLWQPLMSPLIQHLKAHNFHQSILIPTGYLSLLPLHAAWTANPSRPTGRRYALDDIHFTYAPNAKSLTTAQTILASTAPADAILAIDNPNQDLPNSEHEIQTAISSFLPFATILRHSHATTAAVKAALPSAPIAHFSCHGTANLTDPLNSGLLMSDGLLSLRDLLDLRLSEQGGIRLAVLSACETGLAGTELADEAISLPTGLLQAGVAGVVASLWSVSDRSTMMLLVRFYDLWRNQNLPPAVALRQAQQWLRDSTEGELADHFGFLTSTPEARPYAHPFHWAAFSYTGV